MVSTADHIYTHNLSRLASDVASSAVLSTALASAPNTFRSCRGGRAINNSSWGGRHWDAGAQQVGVHMLNVA
eukprot:scaffold47845_cov37-Tisochrysis_lutea.AAC.2